MRVIAAVRLVLPWSTWPIVPMLTCGLLRSNFAFPMELYSPESLARDIDLHTRFIGKEWREQTNSLYRAILPDPLAHIPCGRLYCAPAVGSRLDQALTGCLPCTL